jgi:Bacterial regulatory protein, arsR family
MPLATALPDAAVRTDGDIVARALGDPLRWRIIGLLAGEQFCVGHLAEALGAAQPLVSHHLKVLREAGLIQAERYRYWTYYRLRPAPARPRPPAAAWRQPPTHHPARPAIRAQPPARSRPPELEEAP